MPNVSTSGGVSTQQYQFTRAGSNLPQTPPDSTGKRHAQSSSGVQVRITPENFRQVLGSNADVLLTPQDMKKLYEQGHLDVQRQFSTMESNEGILTLTAKLAAALVGPSKSIGAITIDPMFLEMIKDPNAEVGMGYTRVRSETLRVLPGPTPTESPGRVERPEVPPYVPPGITATPSEAQRRSQERDAEIDEMVEAESTNIYSLSNSAMWVGAGRSDAKANSYDSTLEGSMQEMFGWTGKLEGSKAQFVNANIINLFTGDMGQQNSYDQANYILNGSKTSRTQWASRRVDTTHTTQNPNDSVNQASSNHKYHFLATQHRSIPLTGPFLEQYSNLRAQVTAQGGTLDPAPAAPSMYDLYLLSNKATTLGDPIQNNSPDAQQNQTGLQTTYSTLYQQVTGQPVPADLDWNKVSMEDVYTLSVMRDGGFSPAQVGQVISNNNGDISLKNTPESRALIASITGSPQGGENMSASELIACHRLNLESNFAHAGGRTFQFTQADADRVHDLMAPVMQSRGVSPAEIESARMDRTDAAALAMGTFEKDNQLEGTSGNRRPGFNRSGGHNTTMDRAALVAGTVAGSQAPAALPDTTANAAYGPLNNSVSALRTQVALDHMNPGYSRPRVDQAFRDLQAQINSLPDSDPNKAIYGGELTRLRDIDRAARGQYVQVGTTSSGGTPPDMVVRNIGSLAVPGTLTTGGAQPDQDLQDFATVGRQIASLTPEQRQNTSVTVGGQSYKLSDWVNAEGQPGPLQTAALAEASKPGAASGAVTGTDLAANVLNNISQLNGLLGQGGNIEPGTVGRKFQPSFDKDIADIRALGDQRVAPPPGVEGLTLDAQGMVRASALADALENMTESVTAAVTIKEGQTATERTDTPPAGAVAGTEGQTPTVQQPAQGGDATVSGNAPIQGAVATGGNTPVQGNTPAQASLTDATFLTGMNTSLTQFNDYLRSALADGGISSKEKLDIVGGPNAQGTYQPGLIDNLNANMRGYLQSHQLITPGSTVADMHAIDAEDLKKAVPAISEADQAQILNMLDRMKSAQAATNLSSEGNLTRSLFQNLSALSKRVEEFDSVGVVQAAFKGEMTRLASPISQGGNPAGFDAMMAATYGFAPPSATATRDDKGNLSPADDPTNKAYNALRDLAAKGNLPIPPNIGFVDRAAIGGANGAFVENARDPDEPTRQSGRTILLARDLANQPERMREVYAEEMFHHLEVLPDVQFLLRTNPANQDAVYTGDAEGDEGRAGVAAMRAAQGNRSPESIQQAADHVRLQPVNLTQGANFSINNPGSDDAAVNKDNVYATDPITGEQIAIIGEGQRVEFSTQPAGGVAETPSTGAIDDAARADFSSLAAEFAPRFREIDRGSGSTEEKEAQREALAAELSERFADKTSQQATFQWHNDQIYGKQDGQVTLWTGTGVPASLPKLPSEAVFAPGHEVNPINVNPTQGRQEIYDRGGFGRDPGTAQQRLDANFGSTRQTLEAAEAAAANNQPAPEGTLSASFDTNSSSEMMRTMLSGAGDMLSSAGLSMMRQADKLMDLVSKWFSDVSSRLGDSGTLVSQTMSRDIENAGRGGAGEENAMRTNKTYDYFQNTDRRWDRNPNYQRSEQGLNQKANDYDQRMGTTSAEEIKRRADIAAAKQRSQQQKALLAQEGQAGQTTA